MKIKRFEFEIQRTPAPARMRFGEFFVVGNGERRRHEPFRAAGFEVFEDAGGMFKPSDAP